VAIARTEVAIAEIEVAIARAEVVIAGAEVAVAGTDHLPLRFGDFRSPGFETLNSFGVWAKNSARDIAGKEARALAELICSAIFR
jgi:hypothetical protein